MIGLYVHVPFCVQKCHYCDFVIAAGASADKRSEFLDCLESEARRWADSLGERIFETVYVGGGTPSTLRPAEVERLFRIVRKNFRIKKDAEVTFEVNPGDLDDVGAGFINRVSLGAQSFNDATLKEINRAHDARDTHRSFQALRKRGFKNINLDLILSLPGETLADVQNSLREAVRLGPEHLSLYELTIEPNTVFGRRFQRGKLPLPDEDLQLEILAWAREFLAVEGYRHYELLNYARPGFESRHNRLYWANGEYLGLGPGAFSCLGGRRFRHSRSVSEYLKKARAGDWRAAESEVLDPPAREIESFLLALRLAEGASRGRFGDLLPRLVKNLAELETKGLLVQDAQSVRLTPRGQLFAETVFSELSVC